MQEHVSSAEGLSFRLDAPLDELAIPARVRNALKRLGVTSLREASAHTRATYLSLRGFGEGSLRRLEALLQLHGTQLADQHPSPSPGSSTAATASGRSGSARQSTWLTGRVDPLHDLLSSEGLGPELVANLGSIGATTFADLACVSLDVLMAQPAVDLAALDLLSAALRRRGAELGEGLPPGRPDSLAPQVNRPGQRHTTSGIDVPLAELGLSRRLRVALEASGARTLSDAARVPMDGLRARRNFGAGSEREFLALLHDHGLDSGDSEQRRGLPPLVELVSSAGGLELSSKLRHALEEHAITTVDDLSRLDPSLVIAAKKPDAALRAELDELIVVTARTLAEYACNERLGPDLVPEAVAISSRMQRDLPLGRLLDAVPLTGNADFKRQATRLLFGLDGGPVATLQAVGDQFGVSRERIRQQRELVLQAIREQPVMLQRMRAFNAAFKALAPCLVEDAGRRLERDGWLMPGEHAAGLFHLSGHFEAESTHVLVELNERAVLLRRSDRKLVRKIQKRIPLLIDRWGCLQSSMVADDLAVAGEPRFLDAIIRLAASGLPGFAWLDEGQEWFWVAERPRNRIVSRVLKILAAHPVQSLESLRRGVQRDHRMQGFAPPVSILASICARLPGVVVEDQHVRAVEPVPRSWLGSAERRLVERIEAQGGVAGLAALERMHAGDASSRASLLALLSWSPALRHLARGVYGIRGRSFSHEQIERASDLKRQARVLQRHGRTDTGMPWSSYIVSEGVLRVGLLAVPAQLSAELEGEYEFHLEDGSVSGRCCVRGTSSWGWGRLVRRGRLEVGDVLLVEWDTASRRALLRIGEQDLLERYADEPLTTEAEVRAPRDVESCNR